MHKRGMNPAAIEAALLAENAAQCSPPLPVQKVKAIAHDIPTRYPNPASSASSKPTLVPDLLCLADVAARPVHWLWEPYIPLGMLSMLSGDPGVGKSFIALALAAELSRGRLHDGRTMEPTNILYLTCENPIAECLRPRFDLLGGDPRYLHLLLGARFEVDGKDQRRAVALSDVEILEEAIVETGARLVVIDPIQSYFGANVDLHRSNETRPVLDGLAHVAESHSAAFLLLRHLSKQAGGKAIHRGLGSIDLTGAVRSEMLAGSLPDEPDARALLHVKTNVGAKGGAQGYAIDALGRFSWTGESSITESDLLAAPARPEGGGAKAEAEDWLRDRLSQGSMESKEICTHAKEVGISFATLRRAKDALHVQSLKSAVRGGWLWALPAM
jgi:putative DNA primase/helicase